MLNLIFVRPTFNDEASLAKYKRMMLENDSSMDGCGSLRKMDDMQAWIKECQNHEEGINLPKNYVRATQFAAKDSAGEIVGLLQVRHTLSDYLLNYGGHIGYSVRPDCRRKGIASWMLAQALDYCRSIGIFKVLITCLEDNEASRKTILKAGGVYEDTRIDGNFHLERYWIELS